MVKPLEDIFAAWNGAAGIPDSQHNVPGIAVCADSDSPAGAIVLSCVLQKILHNERGVPFFSDHKEAGRKFLLDFHIGRIRKRAKIIKPLIDELTKIHRYGCDLKMASIHSRQKKQIVDDSSQTMRLMEQDR